MNSETINVIRKTATERLERITEYCSYRDGYPLYFHDLFYLYTFISLRSPERYYDELGYTEVNLENVVMAKQFFQYGPVSDFEKQCITMLNNYLTKRDRESKLLPMHYDGGGKPYGMANQS